MLLHEIYSEAMSYYQDVYCKYDGRLWFLHDINMPDEDGHDDYGDPIYDGLDDNDMDLEDGFRHLTGYMREVTLDSSEENHRHPHYLEVPISEIDFSFPDTGLVNLPINFSGIDEEFNVVKYISRTANRQWRRAIRNESISASLAYYNIHSLLREGTGVNSVEFHNGVSNNTIYRMFNPVFFTVDEALHQLNTTIGTYAISREWWVGQGKHGLIFGNGTDVCGKIDDDTGHFKFESEDLSFLKESLIEIIGENCYEA